MTGKYSRCMFETMGGTKKGNVYIYNEKQDSSCHEFSGWSSTGSRVIYTNMTYFFGSWEEHIIFQFYIHVQRLYTLIVHLPEHWFHMVLETGYKHLRHHMKSVSECSHLLNNSTCCLQKKLILWEKKCQKAKAAAVCKEKMSCICSSIQARLPILQPNSRGCGHIASHSQNQWSCSSGRNFIVELMKLSGIFLWETVSAKLAGNSRVSVGTPPTWVSMQHWSQTSWLTLVSDIKLSYCTHQDTSEK